jgi:16S rRNA (guanine966-N2)-methyltransferase
MKTIATKATHTGANRLRIIGGQWRGTKLTFPAVGAIRPTPDRVRETVFNWLQMDIANSNCLDLFAGSGALGLEAMSRGASSVTFVDREAAIGKYLRETLVRLRCPQIDIRIMDAMQLLQQPGTAYDIVFLDPPFAASAQHQLLSNIFAQLESNGWLSSDALIYIECPSTMGSPDTVPGWPPTWTLHRSKQTGQVGYHLAKRNAASEMA